MSDRNTIWVIEFALATNQRGPWLFKFACDTRRSAYQFKGVFEAHNSRNLWKYRVTKFRRWDANKLASTDRSSERKGEV